MKGNIKDSIFRIYANLCITLVITIIIGIIGDIFIQGNSEVNFEFIKEMPKGMPLGSKGGIFSAIVGSIYLTIIAAVSGTIPALATAVYLQLYCANEKWVGIIHIVIHCTAGIPSIVLGLFGYHFFVCYLGIGMSLLAAGITLGIMIFPFIEVRIEKIFEDISQDLIEASYALGMPKYYTLIKLIIPVYILEMISAVCLASGFAMGAVAPIIFTGAVIFATVPNSLFSPFMALPYHLYLLIGEGISIKRAYATAVVLLILLLIINAVPMFVLLYKRRYSE